MTWKEHKLVDGGLKTQLVRHDESVLWGIQGQRPPLGCRTFLMVFFSSMVFLGNLVHDVGASVSISDIQTHEARSGEDKERVRTTRKRHRRPLDHRLPISQLRIRRASLDEERHVL